MQWGIRVWLFSFISRPPLAAQAVHSDHFILRNLRAWNIPCLRVPFFCLLIVFSLFFLYFVLILIQEWFVTQFWFNLLVLIFLDEVLECDWIISHFTWPFTTCEILLVCISQLFSTSNNLLFRGQLEIYGNIFVCSH